MIKVIIGLALALNGAQALAGNCDKGTLAKEKYEISDTALDKFGRFDSTLKLSTSGELKGKGRYIVSEDGQFAYTEVKYNNRKSGLKAILTIDWDTEGGFMTLCMGTDLRDTKKYECTSCVTRH